MLCFFGVGWVFVYKNGKLVVFYFNFNECVGIIKGFILFGFFYRRLKVDR